MRATFPKAFSPEVVAQGFGSGGLSTYTIALEAWRRGLTVMFQDHVSNRYELSDGNRTFSMSQSRSITLTSDKDLKTLVNKNLTKRLLSDAGLPVPEGVLINSRDDPFTNMRQFADRVGYPLVLKPNSGSSGKGVLTRIETWERLVNGYTHLVDDLGVSSFVLEQHYDGDDLRLLVIGDKAVAACKRVPANVTGDGTSTVQQLIEAKNASRHSNPFLSKGLIVIDYEVSQRLEEEGLSPSAIPAADRYVPLRSAANASAGGDVIDVTDSIPDVIRDAAVRAIKAVPNIHIAGVDILYNENKQASDSRAYTILEMNPRPQIGVNMYPTDGVGQDVPDAYLDFLFPNSSRSQHTSDFNLTFELSLIKPILRSGFAEFVKVAPLAQHHYPVRTLFTYNKPKQTRISKTQRDSIQRIARDLEIVGSLKLVGSEIHLLVCSGSVPDATKLRLTFEDFFGETLSSTREETTWTGPVFTGFKVDGRLL